MSEINIYDDTENLISSDEYSEEDDELMNAAISSQNKSKSDSVLTKSTPTRARAQCIFKNIKLPVKKKWSSLFKKRAIKWLNNKQKRQKCKQLLSSIRKINSAVPGAYTEQNAADINPVGNAPVKIFSDGTDTKMSPQKESSYPKANGNGQEAKLLDSHRSGNVGNNDQKYQENINELTRDCKKRTRSPSPVSRSNCNEGKRYGGDRTNNLSVYKEINELYPKHDEIVGKHIKVSNNTIEAIEENMTRLLLDIQTLNDILQTKEAEWNKLLHLKKVKEEILTRLVRKKHIIDIKEKHIDEKKYGLRELKELEMYLSNNNTSSTSTCASSHHLIESRANMKAEDLEKERVNTNRLQSILISSNILQRIDSTRNYTNAAKNNVLPMNHTLPTTRSEDLQSYQYLEHKTKVANRGRQGHFKDVKGIIADFRQNNPEILPRVGKRIKGNDRVSDLRTLNPTSYVTSGIDVNNLYLQPSYESSSSNYAPTLEKLLSTSCRNNKSLQRQESPHSQGFKFNADGYANYYKLHNDGLCDEVSITPISADHRYLQRNREIKPELLTSALDTNTQINTFFDISEYGKTFCKDVSEPILKTAEVQICQACRIHEARFVCAGCGNQWYCSRNCQITAWDKHSETCSE